MYRADLFGLSDVPARPRSFTPRILIIGMGGIGCEILKNLALIGFVEIVIVDFDAIEHSNLNRQLFYRQEHISSLKARVACSAAKKINSQIRIAFHSLNIKERVFNVDWFRSFNIAFSALDNVDARRHVNRMCLAANVKLIESGSTGFTGQAQIIVPCVTECYDCNPKPHKISYPICSIRSHPSQTSHCVSWSKDSLLPKLFAEFSMVDTSHDFANSKNTSIFDVYGQIRHYFFLLVTKKIDVDMCTREIFDLVFYTDINNLLSSQEYWVDRKRPIPLKFSTFAHCFNCMNANEISRLYHVAWSLEQNVVVFCSMLNRLFQRFIITWNKHHIDRQPHNYEFDKSDGDSLDFVISASNIRAFIFGLSFSSKFEIAQIAGNIIPAVATTNSIVASVCIFLSIKALANTDSSHMLFLSQSFDQAITAESKCLPNSNCITCCAMNIQVHVNDSSATLKELLVVLQEEINFNPGITILHSNCILYDFELLCNLDKRLLELGVYSGAILTVIDDSSFKTKPTYLFMNYADSYSARGDQKIHCEVFPKPSRSRPANRRTFKDGNERPPQITQSFRFQDAQACNGDLCGKSYALISSIQKFFRTAEHVRPRPHMTLECSSFDFTEFISIA